MSPNDGLPQPPGTLTLPALAVVVDTRITSCRVVSVLFD